MIKLQNIYNKNEKYTKVKRFVKINLNSKDEDISRLYKYIVSSLLMTDTNND